MHYVNQEGTEIDRTAALGDGDLSKYADQTVKISDWVDNATDGTRKVSGYVYRKAALETWNGTEITAIKVQADGSNYKLYYTTVANPDSATDSDWTEYKDSVSKTGANNVDVYLVFSSTAEKISVHYVDESGNILINPKDKTADAFVSDAGVDVSTLAETIDDYTFSGIAHMGETGWQGFSFKKIRAVKDKDADTADSKINYRFQYKIKDSDTDWTDLTATDIYLIYQKTSDIAKELTVHYVDEDGNVLKEAVTKTAQSVFVTDTENSAQAAINISDWADSIEDYSFVRGRVGTSSAQESAFKQIRAQKDSDSSYHFQYKVKSSDEWMNVTATDVYLIYKKDTNTTPLTIKYIDTDGNELKDEAGDSLTKTIDAAALPTDGSWENMQAYGDLIEGYTVRDHFLVVAKDTRSSDGLEFTASGNWNYSESFGSGDNAISGKSNRYLRYYTVNGTRKFQFGDGYAPTDSHAGAYENTDKNVPSGKANRYGTLNTGEIEIYLVYNKNNTTTTETSHKYTIHYVDEDGNELTTADSAVTIDSSHNSVSVSSISKTVPSGYEKQETGYLGRPNAEDGGIPFTSIAFSQKDGDTENWYYTVTNGSDTGSEKQLHLSNLNIYIVYKAVKATDNAVPVVHHIDAQGNTLHADTYPYGSSTQIRSDGKSGDFTSYWNGNSRGKDTFTTSISGYKVKDIYIGDYKRSQNKYTDDSGNLKGDAILWYYHDGQWHTGYGATQTQYGASGATEVYNSEGQPDYMTGIYVVYERVNNLSLHYVHLDSKNDNGDTKVTKVDTSGHPDVTVNSSKIGTTTANATNVDSNRDDVPSSFEADGKTYYYVGTRIGPAWSDSLTDGDLGTNVRKVYLDNGQLVYYATNSATMSYLRRNTWYLDVGDGRRFELTRTETSEGSGKYNFTLTDSRHGEVTLNQSGDGTYTATFHGEAQTTEYSVSATTVGSTQTYQLSFTDWLPSDQTNIYEIYTSTTNKIWIDDDIKYSGYLKAGLATGVTSGGTYTWYKTVTNSDGLTTTSQVIRKQTGEHYNVEYDPKQRTWLDLEADEGGLNTTTQTAVSYYVTYTQPDGTVLTSDPVSIEYYSQLMNGSFETPTVWKSGNAGDQNGFSGNQTTNANYKAKGGVWQSTGVHSDGRAIEVFNKNQGKTGLASKWYGTITAADDGSQWAELNAETAGALYQDVVTHPNEQLHYWFSHRARGNYDTSTPEYDTMYLVIMPTKLAMTSGSNGGELKEQSDLIDFISSHGGYSYDLATSVGQEVTYRDVDNGILIMKVSSNDQFWHDISEVNAYIAKAGLTRFFFAAGPTSWNSEGTRESGSRANVLNATHGNFIDAVGFSQTFPPTTGFNLEVKKTFTGLTQEQVAALASTSTVNGITAAENPFKIRISDTYYSSSGRNDSLANTALNGAELGFTVSGTKNNITFTPTATLNGTDLLTGNSSASVDVDGDTVTITWDFMKQTLRNAAGDTASNQRFYYTVKEENAGVDKNYLSATEIHSNTDSTGHTTSGTGDSQYIRQGDSAVYTLSNSYSSSSASEQPQLIVTKTFTGLTPQDVDTMLPNYKLKVQKGSDSNNAITLVGNTASPVRRSADESDDIRNLIVTLTKTDNKLSTTDSTTTLTWTIKGWGADENYKITEEGFSDSSHKLLGVTVNGDNVSFDSDATQISKDQLVVGSGSRISTLHYETGSSARNVSKGDAKTLTTISASDQPAAGTNLIIAQYTLSEQKHFVIWTPETLGTNTATAIINKINSMWTDAGATVSNTEFHSSENPGTLSVGQGGAGTISYDSTTQALSFSNNGDQLSWDQFYSTKYWVGESDSDSGKYTDTDIAVANSYQATIHLLKVDSGDSTETLSGAKFRLYQLDGQTKKYYLTGASDEAASGNFATVDNVDSNTADSKEASGTKALAFVTGSDGMLSIPKLGSGTYYLEETTAPKGYLVNTYAIGFKINSDNTVSLLNSNGQVVSENKNSDGVTLTWNSPYYVLTVPDEQDHTSAADTVAVHKTVEPYRDASGKIVENEFIIRMSIDTTSLDTKLNKVEDQMGPAITFLGKVSVDGTIDPDKAADSTGTTITWTPTINNNAQTEERTNGETTKTWYVNVATFVYRIRLDVKSDSFVNGGSEIKNTGESALTENNFTPTAEDQRATEAAEKHLNAANTKATLTYDTDKTIDFPIPYVRGTTYTFSFRKVDSTDISKTLSGVEFELYDNTEGSVNNGKLIKQHLMLTVL